MMMVMMMSLPLLDLVLGILLKRGKSRLGIGKTAVIQGIPQCLWLRG